MLQQKKHGISITLTVATVCLLMISAPASATETIKANTARTTHKAKPTRANPNLRKRTRVRVVKPRKFRTILPDLQPIFVGTTNDCKLKFIVRNNGGIIPASAYGSGSGVLIKLYRAGNISFGSLHLAKLDPNRVLAGPSGGTVTWIWTPAFANFNSPLYGDNDLKLVVDNLKRLPERNENNNEYSRHNYCRL